MPDQSSHSLLDYLKNQMQVEYLSDLCFLQANQHIILLQILTDIPTGIYSVRQWNSTIDYFTHKRSNDSSASFELERDAKEFLVGRLHELQNS